MSTVPYFNWVNDLDAGREQGRTERPRDPSKLPRAPTDINDRYRKLQRTLTEQHQRQVGGTPLARRAAHSTCRAAQRCGKRIQRAVYCRPELE